MRYLSGGSPERRPVAGAESRQSNAYLLLPTFCRAPASNLFLSISKKPPRGGRRASRVTTTREMSPARRLVVSNWRKMSVKVLFTLLAADER